jgi:hypothetical protein
MSEDFVNNITLNYLISKNQLQKLNKKMKQTKEEAMKSDREIYKEKIISLFMELLENDRASVNVLEEVKNGFDYFVEKTIYHIKMQEITQERENELQKCKENDKITVTKSSSSSSLVDIDDTNGHIDDDNIEEEDCDEDEDVDEDVDEDEELFSEDLEEEKETKAKPQVVFKKHSTQRFDWFDKVKNEKISNKIIPKF